MYGASPPHSVVEPQPEPGSGILSDLCRMYVAFAHLCQAITQSRPPCSAATLLCCTTALCRYGLILLGNPRVLSRQPLWNALLTHFKEHVSTPPPSLPPPFHSAAEGGGRAPCEMCNPRPLSRAMTPASRYCLLHHCCVLQPLTQSCLQVDLQHTNAHTNLHFMKTAAHWHCLLL
jgi:hypothetical protein